VKTYCLFFLINIHEFNLTNSFSSHKILVQGVVGWGGTDHPLAPKLLMSLASVLVFIIYTTFKMKIIILTSNCISYYYHTEMTNFHLH